MSFSDFIRTHCCSTMELKAKAVLLLVCVTIIILTSTEVDAIACCLTVSRIPKRMLVSVSTYQIQERSGVCDIDAVILSIRKKKICAHPEVLNRMKRIKKKNPKPKRTQKKAK